jgi:PAS domain-containing protein
MPRFDAGGVFVGYRGVAQDITPVIAERSATARANMRFLYAIENGSDAFAFWDVDDRFVMCNENFRHRSGRSAKLLTPGISFEQFAWESIRLGDSPADPGKAAELHAERLAHHRAATGEPMVHERAGRRLRNRVLRTPDGGRLTVSAVVEDMTKSGQSAA